MNKKNTLPAINVLLLKTKVLIKENKTLRNRLANQTKKLKNSNKVVRTIVENFQTEKKAFADAKARDAAILSSIGDGIIATDSNRKIIIMNKAAEKLLGWNIKEAIGKVYDDIISLEDEKGTFFPPNKRPLNKAFTRSTITNITTISTTGLFLLSKNKIKFPVAINMTPVILGKKVIGAVEIFRDITKEKEIDKAKTEFVSLASHQLRTPLSAVSWYTEMLLNGDVGKLNKGQKKYLDEVYKNNKRMVVLVNTLLNVSRLELGTIVSKPEPTHVAKLVRRVADEQKSQVAEKQIEIFYSFKKNIPLIQVDPKLLGMVVQNLLSNAIKYTPKKGKIILSLTRDNKKKAVLFKISDTGCGIPKKQQDSIFTKLFRADNVRKKDSEGTGLGLYIAKSLITHSGGKIWFESEEDKGSTFYVTLPLAGIKKKEETIIIS